jgi:lambda family phage portal protein
VIWPFNKKPRKRSLSRLPRRGFAAAEKDRLTNPFEGTSLSINELLKVQLPTLRKRSRQLTMDNDYARRFLGMVKANVIGTNGIVLQSRAKRGNGDIDADDSTAIERAWGEWGRVENCTMTGRLSWRDVQRLAIETVARDGECLVRFINTSANPYGLALHVFESDHLDVEFNRQRERGLSEVRMGVEVDTFGRPTGYYLRASHPGDETIEWRGKTYERVDATQMLHLYMTDRPGQIRGVPWLQTAIRRLNMLGGYEEAELVAARVSASKMGFYTSPDGDQYTGDDEDGAGNLVTDVEPGLFEQLPAGMGFEAFDPQHPTTAFDSFVRAALRGAAAGLNVSYHTLANDLEKVNFSSIRSGVLEEREQWRLLQGWFIEQFMDPIYRRWLRSALTTSALALPPEKIKKFEEVVWQPRGWSWVDPLKDQKANAEGVALGVTTRSDIAASQGKDLEEIFQQLQREKALAEQYGLTLTSQQSEEPANGID